MRPIAFSLLAIPILIITAAAAPPNYDRFIIGPWRYHTAQRPDRIVIFHPDGSWGVRNWDFTKPEDIRGRRWHIDANALVITAPPAEGGQTVAERIVSFTQSRFVTEINDRRFYYTRIKRWPPKSPNQTLQPTAGRSGD